MTAPAVDRLHGQTACSSLAHHQLRHELLSEAYPLHDRLVKVSTSIVHWLYNSLNPACLTKISNLASGYSQLI